MPSFRRGVRLAIDWGKARIGVAACDADALLAYPVETVPNDDSTMARLQTLIAEYQPIEIVLGWPKNLRGQEGPAVEYMSQVAEKLTVFGLDIRLIDERLTTATVNKQFLAMGKSTKKTREIVDQAAAAAILTSAIEEEKQTLKPPGRLFQDGR
uniref:Holliday junction resolvase RuvX n=1 Tax=Vaginimicrobium propionicum TaxID=1871034 RepID=UPI001E28FC82|nr:Holliday junction resolvase RuvX [Vaginimicrobium propionicum]